MTPHLRRRLAAILAVAGVAAGCGQASSTTAPSAATKTTPALAKALVAVASRTTRAGSARIAMTMTTSTQQGDLTMRAQGLTTFHRPQQVALSMNMQVPGSSSALAMQERLLDGAIYMRAPWLTSRIPGGKPWLKLDLAALSRMQGLNLGALMNASQNDPSQFLGYLQGVTSGVRAVGSAKVNGVPTTHYRAVIDVRKAAARFPAKLRRQYLRLMDRAGTDSLPVDVWVGHDGLVRQERLHMDMWNVESGMTVVMRLSDFGVPVHVTAPPAGETTDLAKLLERTA